MTALTPEQLYLSYHDRVLRFFQSRLDSREDAEDLCSEVFLKATRALPRFDEERSSVSTWLYTISRNTLTDYLRRRRGPDTLSQQPPEDLPAETLLLRQETLRELAAALSALEQEQRDIVILHYYSGHSLTEIARLMCLSYGAVKLRHQKALKALRRALSGAETER